MSSLLRLFISKIKPWSLNPYIFWTVDLIYAILALKHLYRWVDHFSTACLALMKYLMYCLFIVLWFVFPIDVDSDASTLDNLQEQDFEQFEQQGQCPCHILYLFLVSIYRIACYYFCWNCGNTYVSYLSMYYPCYLGLGRALECFTSCLAYWVWG
jgi:hypothetical protein